MGAGTVVKIAVHAWAPYVIVRPSKHHSPNKTEYGGPIFDFFFGLADKFTPKSDFVIVPGWATARSRAKFSSSYTACVHDVAVGNIDICVADLWHTPERA